MFDSTIKDIKDLTDLMDNPIGWTVGGICSCFTTINSLMKLNSYKSSISEKAISLKSIQEDNEYRIKLLIKGSILAIENNLKKEISLLSAETTKIGQQAAKEIAKNGKSSLAESLIEKGKDLSLQKKFFTAEIEVTNSEVNNGILEFLIKKITEKLKEFLSNSTEKNREILEEISENLNTLEEAISLNIKIIEQEENNFSDKLEGEELTLGILKEIWKISFFNIKLKIFRLIVLLFNGENISIYAEECERYECENYFLHVKVDNKINKLIRTIDRKFGGPGNGGNRNSLIFLKNKFKYAFEYEYIHQYQYEYIPQCIPAVEEIKIREKIRNRQDLKLFETIEIIMKSFARQTTQHEY